METIDNAIIVFSDDDYKDEISDVFLNSLKNSTILISSKINCMCDNTNNIIKDLQFDLKYLQQNTKYLIIYTDSNPIDKNIDLTKITIKCPKIKILFSIQDINMIKHKNQMN